MPPVRDYYEILGVARTATQDEIRASFRRLVRKYHPDVHPDKTLAQKAFVQINEAYQTLSDPSKRRSYDLARNSTYRPPSSGLRNSGPSRTQARPRAGESAGAMGLIKQAEYAFIKGRLGQAESLCLQALKLSPTSARACTILGDVYHARSQDDKALKYYSFAVQFDPANRDIQNKLDRLLARGAKPPRRNQSSSSARLPAPHAFVANLLGWTAFFLIFIIVDMLDPGLARGGLQEEGFLSEWNAAITACIAAQGLLMGSLLRGMNFLSHYDDDLLFQTLRKGTRKASAGVGALVLAVAAAFFWLGLALYLMLGVLQESSSRSLNRVFTVITVYVLTVALIAEPFRLDVLLIGGSITFIAVLSGWWLVDVVRDNLAISK